MADKEKKTRGRRRFLDDYRPVGGKFVYVGAYYCFNGDSAVHRRFGRVTVACALAAVAVAVAVGCMRQGGFDRPYVLLPYVASLIAGAFAVYDAVRLANAGEKLNREQYETGAKRLPGAALAQGIALALAALGQAGYLIFDRAGLRLPNDVLGLVGLLAAAAAAVVLYKTARAAAWTEKPQA